MLKYSYSRSNNKYKLLLSCYRVAKLLNVKPNKVRELIYKAKISPVWIDKKYYLREDHIDLVAVLTGSVEMISWAHQALALERREIKEFS